MRASDIGFRSGFKRHQRFSEFTEIDYCQLKWVIGERGEGLLAQARNPEEDELTRFNVDFPVEAQNADVIGNAFVVNKRYRPETHIDVVSDQRFRLLGSALQIAGQGSEIVGYLVGCHADQRRPNANN